MEETIEDVITISYNKREEGMQTQFRNVEECPLRNIVKQGFRNTHFGAQQGKVGGVPLFIGGYDGEA